MAMESQVSKDVHFFILLTIMKGRSEPQWEEKVVLEAYRKHVEERAAEGVVPKPLDAEQVAGLVELLKNPPQGEEEIILDLLENRIPPGVDEAAYVKLASLRLSLKVK